MLALGRESLLFSFWFPQPAFWFVSVSQSWSTPAVMVENRGPTKTPGRKPFSIKQTRFVPTTSDQIKPFELADLTRSIGRAGWEGVISGEKNRWEIDSTIFSGRKSGCEACSGGDWPFLLVRRSSQKGEARCLDCILGSLGWLSHWNQKDNPVKDISLSFRKSNPVLSFLRYKKRTIWNLLPTFFVWKPHTFSPQNDLSSREGIQYLPKPVGPWADPTLAPRRWSLTRKVNAWAWVRRAASSLFYLNHWPLERTYRTKGTSLRAPDKEQVESPCLSPSTERRKERTFPERIARRQKQGERELLLRISPSLWQEV